MITKWFYREFWLMGLGVCLLGSGLMALVVGAKLLWGDAGVVDGATWMALVLLAIPSSWAVAVPLAGVVGSAMTLARWNRQGSWQGLMSTGVRGRSLILGVSGVGVVCALVAGTMTLGVEPWLRRAGRGMVIQGTASVEFWPGQTLNAGEWSIRPEGRTGHRYSRVFLASPDVTGSAETLSVSAVQGRLWIEMENGVFMGQEPQPWTLSFGRWRIPYEIESSPRLEMMERSNRELRAMIAKTRADGRDASYEEAVLYKRWMYPVTAFFFPLCLLPVGVRRFPGIWLAGAGITYILMARLGDFSAPWFGPFASAATGLVCVLLMGVVAWISWRDR